MAQSVLNDFGVRIPREKAKAALRGFGWQFDGQTGSWYLGPEANSPAGCWATLRQAWQIQTRVIQFDKAGGVL